MKWIKWGLGIGAFLAGLLVVAIALVLLSSSVQRSIVLSVLEDQTDSVSLEGITINPDLSSVELRNLKLSKEGAEVAIESAEIKANFLQLFKAQTIRLDKAHVQGAVIDLRSYQSKTSGKPAKQTEESSDASPLADFEGIFHFLQLPFACFIEGVDIDASVLLPDERMLVSKIKGGGIAPGKEGQLQVDASWSGPTPDGIQTEVKAQGAITFQQLENQEISQLSLMLEIEGEKANLEAPAKVKLNLAMKQKEGIEHFQAAVFNLASGESGSPLVNVEGTFDTNKKLLSGKFALEVLGSDVRPFLSLLKFPDFEAKGTGSFQSDVQNEQGNLIMDIKMSAQGFDVWDTRLGSLPPLSVQLGAEVAFQATLLDVSRLELNVQDRVADKVHITVQALQSFQIDATDLKAFQKVPEGELISLALNEIPVTWVDPWVSDYQLSGDPISLALHLNHSEAAWQIQSKEKWSLNKLSATQGGEPQLHLLDIEVSPGVRLDARGLNVELSKLRLMSERLPLVQGELVLQLSGYPEFALKRVNIDIKSNIAQLLEQPALSPYNNCATGELKLVGTVQSNTNGYVPELKIEVKNLLLKEPKKKINVASLDVAGEVNWPQSVSLKIPVNMVASGGVSECLMAVELAQQDSMVFNVDVSGKSMNVSDLMLMGTAFQKPVAEAEPAVAEIPEAEETDPRKKDEQPIWAGYVGQAKVNLGRLKYEQYSLSEVKAEVNVQEQQVSIQQLNALFADAPFVLNGNLDFVATSPKPYQLSSQLSWQEVSSVKLFQALQLGNRAFINGDLNLVGEVKGSGENLAVLAEEIQGDIELLGSAGAIRPLANTNTMKQGLTRAITAASSIGLFAEIAGVGEHVKELPVLRTVLSLIEKVPYESFRIALDRSENLDIQISEISLNSPDLKLNASGIVQYEPGKAIPLQPMNIVGSFGGKGRMAQLLEYSGALSGEQDTQGYYVSKNFEVPGTLSDPNLDNLKSLFSRLTRLGPNFNFLNTTVESKQSSPQSPTNSAANANVQESVPEPERQTREAEPIQQVEDVARELFNIFGR